MTLTAEKLSTAPEDVAELVPGARRRRFSRLLRPWRQLTSMHTALQLLFLLAVAAVPGSLIPQRGVNPLRVQQYIAAHPASARLLTGSTASTSSPHPGSQRSTPY